MKPQTWEWAVVAVGIIVLLALAVWLDPQVREWCD